MTLLFMEYEAVNTALDIIKMSTAVSLNLFTYLETQKYRIYGKCSTTLLWNTKVKY